jgi:hypothetical protein
MFRRIAGPTPLNFPRRTQPKCNLNVSRLKGSHATIKSWMLAADAAFDAVQAGRQCDELVAYPSEQSPATALAKMRQDKLLELRGTQFRWNPLPWLAFRHLDHQSNGILAVRSYLPKPFPGAACDQIPALKNPQPVAYRKGTNPPASTPHVPLLAIA